jgi:putative endonuclease
LVRRTSRAVGQQAELEAEAFLIERGLATVTRNFSCRLGEIDLVMRDGGCLVFTEVRFRAGRRLAAASLSVDRRKQAKLVRTAALFLGRHQRLATLPTRFDVVAIDVDDRGRRSLEWIRDAFRPADAAL